MQRRFSKIRSDVKTHSMAEMDSLISEQGLLSFAMSEFSRVVLTQAVERLCSSMKGTQSWGEDEGYVRAGLLKIPIKRPRVRCGDREVEIADYKRLQKRTEFDEAVRRSVMGGLTTRQFTRVGEALGRSKGLSKSVVSRVSKSFAQDFEKLMAVDCSDIMAVFIDGIHFTNDICVIAALGISRFGPKRLLGLWAGGTETREVVATMLDDLKTRNLSPKIFIIDGSKALRSGIAQKFSGIAVQRCQIHKKRNILEHVGENHVAWARLQMSKIFQAPNWKSAFDHGRQFGRELAKINDSAARSWAEAFPEVITVAQIENEDLRRTLCTTNPVESLFSVIRGISGRVKRWRNANQALFWTAGCYFRVEKNLNRVRGYKFLEQLEKIRQTQELLKESAA